MIFYWARTRRWLFLKWIKFTLPWHWIMSMCAIKKHKVKKKQLFVDKAHSSCSVGANKMRKSINWLPCAYTHTHSTHNFALRFMSAKFHSFIILEMFASLCLLLSLFLLHQFKFNNFQSAAAIFTAAVASSYSSSSFSSFMNWESNQIQIIIIEAYAMRCFNLWKTPFNQKIPIFFNI